MEHKLNNKKGFTIVEILISLLIASIVLITLLTFFGDTFQKFVQHEDTLTSAREMHKLLEYLRKDIEILVPSGMIKLSDTYPQQRAHIYHTHNSPILRTYHWTKDSIGEPFENTDPIVQNLPSSVETDRLLSRYSAFASSNTWSIDQSDGEDKKKFILDLAIQPDPGATSVKTIRYVYDEESKTVTRFEEGKEIIFAKGAIKHFSVIPVYDFYNFQDQPERTIVLNKMFFDIALSIQADKDGGKIVKRSLNIATKACPRLINNSVSARWSN